MPAVWIDHEAYARQRHKQCAFNLYVAAMLRHALAPIAGALSDGRAAEHYVELSQAIERATVARFWDAARGLFVNNLPWLKEEGRPRLCDRSLATALLFDQCPGGATTGSLRALAESPPELGISYPANAVWRYRALAGLGRADVVLAELRSRWATMESVLRNNTIQEFWRARPDSADQWSHCAVAPLLLLFGGIAGVEPLAPGFARCRVRPQLGDLGRLALTAHTVRGPIRFGAEPAGAGHDIMLKLPEGCAGELLLPAGAQANLPPIEIERADGLFAFRVEPGATATCWMPRG